MCQQGKQVADKIRGRKVPRKWGWWKRLGAEIFLFAPNGALGRVYFAAGKAPQGWTAGNTCDWDLFHKRCYYWLDDLRCEEGVLAPQYSTDP